MTQLAELLEAQEGELARLMAAEMGKPIAQGVAEVENVRLGVPPLPRPGSWPTSTSMRAGRGPVSP